MRPAADEPISVDFRRLAVAAGLGWPSLLGLVIHPVFGSWLGLRAACFTIEALPATGPLPAAGPCAGCPAPCRSACPTGAIGADGWDVGRCAAFHLASPVCLGTCHSRRACPEGSAHAYSAEQLAYHEDPGQGRRRLAAALGIEDHRGESGVAWWRRARDGQ